MGADITFKDNKGNELFYFRDSYNATNLAWIINLSYWETYNKTNKEKIKFMKKLKEISDKEIKTYVDKIHKNPKKYNIIPNKNEWIKMFKEKRNNIKQNWNNILKSHEIIWSV